MPAKHDVVIIGSGINSLVAGALLAQRGWTVAVLERNRWFGGAIRTAEITVPGFVHELFSQAHVPVPGSYAYAELRDELERRGVEYLRTTLAVASVFPSGESILLSTEHEDTCRELERYARGDGVAWDNVVESLTTQAHVLEGMFSCDLWSPAGLAYAARTSRRLGPRGLAELTGRFLLSCRDWVGETFRSAEAHGLFAPLSHSGLAPEAAGSALMAQLAGLAIERHGIPMPRGGGSMLVSALVGIIRDAGGTCELERDVVEIPVSGGCAAGVRTADGDRWLARRAVLANVTPQQLYLRLLPSGAITDSVRSHAQRFRYGLAGMQIHYALSELPQWVGDERLARTPTVHVTSGVDGISRAVNEAQRGLLPSEPTIVVGQPVVVDPSRAPRGASILWIQLLELPAHPEGDAAGEIDVGDGTWTDELREHYAARVEARLAAHIPNLTSSVLGRVSFSPADLEAANVNLVGGGLHSGSCALDQSFVWRPRPELPGHRTAVSNLFHIGASTWPGPGLGAGSGTLVARELLRQRRIRGAAMRVAGRGRSAR